MNIPQEAAEFLLRHRQQSSVIETIPPDCYPHSVELAYETQDLVVESLCQQHRSEPCGYKLACTNRPVMELLNVDGPFSGRLLTHSMYESGVSLDSGMFTRRVVEPEFVLVIQEDVPWSNEPYDASSVKPFIGKFHPGIEIVDHRYADFTRVGGGALIAENAIHGCCVLGQSDETMWKSVDLENLAVTLNVNGVVTETGAGKNVLGSPLNAMAWLANHLQNRNRHLKAGDIVTTGTACNVYYADPEDELTVDFGTLGSVSMSFH